MNIPETPLKLTRRLYWTETDCTRWQQLALQASGPKATRLSTALEPPGTQKELAACVISNLGFSLVKPCCRSTFSKQLFHLLGSEQAHAGLQQMSMTGLHQDHVSFFDHSSHDTRCSGIMLRVLGLTAWRLGLGSGLGTRGVRLHDVNIGALIIRTRFWGPLYYNRHEEPPKELGNYSRPYSNVLGTCPIP